MLVGCTAAAAATATAVCFAAIIVVFVGAVLMHDLKRQPWLNWMLPIGLVLGLLVVVGIATELPKLKVSLWEG